MEIDVIRVRNKNDKDPTKFYDLNSIDDLLHLCKEAGVPVSKTLLIIDLLEEGKRVDGTHLNEPNLYFQGATKTIYDREVILGGHIP